jgi:hypothetical protein
VYFRRCSKHNTLIDPEVSVRQFFKQVFTPQRNVLEFSANSPYFLFFIYFQHNEDDSNSSSSHDVVIEMKDGKSRTISTQTRLRGKGGNPFGCSKEWLEVVSTFFFFFFVSYRVQTGLALFIRLSISPN